MQKKVKLTKSEIEIEKNILDYKPISLEKRSKITKIIKKANEKKNISLRVNSQDLELLKIRAEKEGMPYQTLISSILHKFITDRLIDQENIIKSIQLLKSNSKYLDGPAC
ncbi:MAG: antitoxin [Candidatus Omnitrophica bacterium]|nr:antitoxin [Candidatus Omnitrophota bacterium]